MKQPALIIIKPDGTSRRIVGKVFSMFDQANLKIIAARTIKPTRAMAREHYNNIKGQPFFESTVSYFCGKFHREKNLLAVIYYGDNAIKKCRKIAGATNPKEAVKKSIRGTYGRVSPAGIFENVVHVSSDRKETEREIKLWFEPNDLTTNLYPTKTNTMKSCRKRVWS